MQPWPGHMAEEVIIAPPQEEGGQEVMARINECGHPERKHQGLGMCNSCYMKVYNKEYRSIPENLAKERARKQTPESRAGRKIYRNTPWGRAVTYSLRTGISRENSLPWFEIPEQDRHCWLCGGVSIGNMELDHDHETLIVRGWSHEQCNMAEGHVKYSFNPQQLLVTLLSMYRVGY
mgnify:FL=1